jgi:Putative transposase
MLAKLLAAHKAGKLQVFNQYAHLAERRAFARYLAPLWNTKWVVYCKRPFGGPKQMLRYLARYTHRVAISNRRLIACDENGVTFKWKDYRIEGPDRYKVMTLATHEFIRRFLIPRPAEGFPSHPSLRPPCQVFLRGKPRAGPRATRRAKAARQA